MAIKKEIAHFDINCLKFFQIFTKYFIVIVFRISLCYNNSMLILIFSIILVVGLIIAGSCYGYFISTYNKYSQEEADVNTNAFNFVKACVEYYGLKTKVMLTEGELTDAYLTKSDIIVLSKKVADGRSVADISVACHELGHAMQKNDDSAWLAVDLLFSVLSKIANFFLPIALITALVLVFIESVSFVAPILFYIAIGLWFLTLIFKIVAIPLELDASKRAYKVLKENKIFSNEELKATKIVLNAAALTYVGSLFANLYKFIYKIKSLFRRD